MRTARLLAPAAAVLIVPVALAACGSTATPTPTGPLGAMDVSGSYGLTRAYISNTCDPAIPGAEAPVTGVVTHTRGASHFTLANSDGGRFDADLRADASFSSGTQRRTGQDGVAYDLLFEGRFTTTGFRATVTVDLLRPAGTCRAAVDWQAVKQGPPNVLA